MKGVPPEPCSGQSGLLSVHLRICKNRETGLNNDFHLVVQMIYWLRLFLSAAQIRYCIMKKGTSPQRPPPPNPTGVLSIKYFKKESPDWIRFKSI